MVQELRNLLASAERENLEKAFVECYKQLRKPQKEECDPVLAALLEGKTAEQTKVDTSVDFETSHSKERNEEITFYCALQLADWMDEKELWLDVYKYGLSKKIKPRDGLQKEYEERQKR